MVIYDKRKFGETKFRWIPKQVGKHFKFFYHWGYWGIKF